MNTTFKRLFLGTATLLCTALCACGNGNDDNTSSFVRFTDKAPTLAPSGGTTKISVAWSSAQGRITTDNKEFIRAINPVYIGSESSKGTAPITLTFSANDGEEARTATLTATNTSTGETSQLTLTQPGAGMATITVDATKEHQTITGFGGMYLPEWANGGADFELSDNDVDALFAPTGLSLNMLRVRISPDKNAWQRIVRVAKRAQSYGAILLASPWSPPAALKSNNNTVGGVLNATSYAAYATHLKEFTDYMTSQGVTIDVVSLQNEPDYQVSYESCDWTPAQMTRFVRENAAAIGDVKIAAAESFQFKRPITDALLADPTAASNFEIVAGHIYGGGITPYPAAQRAGKEVWMTEYNDASEFKGTYADIMRFAETIHDCMEADFNAFIWWYLKRYYSLLGDGVEGTTNGAVLKRGEVFAHYAKYLQGGFRRIGITSSESALKVTSYHRQSDNTHCMVVINPTQNNFARTEIILPTAVKSVTAVRTTASDNRTTTPTTLLNERVQIALPAASIVTLTMEL